MGRLVTARRLYEEGLATGRSYAEADLANHLGTGAEELLLRQEARQAVERKDLGQNSRDFAAHQLGVIRGYRDMVRAPRSARPRLRSVPSDDSGYDLSDPKHPEFHSIHADIWDAREKG